MIEPVITEQAQADLDEAWDYLADRNVAAADRLIANHAMQRPLFQLTIGQMMIAVAILAAFLFVFRVNPILGVFSIGISLPTILWTVETTRLVGARGEAMTIAEQFVLFSRVLLLTVMIYSGTASAIVLIVTLARR